MTGVPGKIFAPMSLTYGFALTGALIMAFTLAPALASLLLTGHVQEQETPVVRGIRRPTYVFPLTTVVPDLAYDAGRDVVYFPEPDAERVSVFSLATRDFAAPIPLFLFPYSVDLTTGGDSLVVALARSTSLAIVNLQNGSVDTVPFPLNPNLRRFGSTASGCCVAGSTFTTRTASAMTVPLASSVS